MHLYIIYIAEQLAAGPLILVLQLINTSGVSLALKANTMQINVNTTL